MGNNCCICDSKKNKLYKTVGEYTLLECRDCGLVYLDQNFSNQISFIEDAKGSLEDSGKEKIEYWSFPDLFAKHKFIFEEFFLERLQRAEEHSPKIKTMMDIGCGYGFWMDYCKKRNISVRGFDISYEAVTYAKETFGLDATTDNLLEFKPTEKYDLTLMFDVLEHLEDPNEGLQKCKDFMGDEGLLYIQVPNLIGFRIPPNHGYGLPHHLWQFNPKSLTTLLEKNDFQVLGKWTGPMGVIGAYEKGTNLFWKKIMWSVSSKLNLGTRLQIIAKDKNGKKGNR